MEKIKGGANEPGRFPLKDESEKQRPDSEEQPLKPRSHGDAILELELPEVKLNSTTLPDVAPEHPD